MEAPARRASTGTGVEGVEGVRDEARSAGGAPPLRAVIAGAGIGGLTAALALHRVGIEAEVFEQAQEVRELGVGINLLPHAVKALAGLGLLPALDRAGIRTRRLVYLNRFGQPVWEEPRGLGRRVRRAPDQHPSRPAPGGAVPGGPRAPGRRPRPHRPPAGRLRGARRSARARFERRAERGARRGRGRRPDRRRRHPLGAPGAALPGRGPAGLERPPALARRDRVADLRGRADDGDRRRERRQVRRTTRSTPIPGDPTGGSPTGRSWRRLGDGSRHRRAARTGAVRGAGTRPCPSCGTAFGLDFVDPVALIEATDTFYEYPCCDRDPLPRWSFGRVTLLGDAAHPMYPTGSNGASQAILDALALARHLTSGAPVADGAGWPTTPSAGRRRRRSCWPTGGAGRKG